MLLFAVWRSPFLPMQDYPQHLFMASVAVDYQDPVLGWSEDFELRHQFGPYRATFLAQRLFGAVTGVESGGRIVVSLYLLLVAALAWRIARDREHVAWPVLLLFPFSLHAMYFYGFLNFTLSIPVLVMALLHLDSLLQGGMGRRGIIYQLLFVLCIFLLHPFTLQVYLVLATLTTVIVARNRVAVLQGVGAVVLALSLFIGWTLYNSAESPGAAFSMASLNLKWWSLQWRLAFLGMGFSGMRFTEGPDWIVVSLWLLVLLMLVSGAILARGRYRTGWPLPLWFLSVVAGYFVLPFSIHLDARYTFFSVRMAPIACFLLVVLVAVVPLGRVLGRGLALASIALLLLVANLHLKVAREIDSYMPLFADMNPGGRVLTLIGSSPSEYLDPFFYANFHYYFPFYYHLRKGGGINADMFDTRLMPIGYRKGRKPPQVARNEVARWAQHRGSYDYVIIREMPAMLHKNVLFYGAPVGQAGPWRAYKLRKSQ